MKINRKKCLIFGLLVFGLLSGLGEVKKAYASSDLPKVQTEEMPEIKMNVKSVSIVKDKSFTLKVYNTSELQTVTYISGNKEIAEVSESGIIKGLSNGSTTVTVTVTEGSQVVATLGCEVTVGPPAISVKFTRSELDMGIGMRRTLKTLVQPSNTVESVKFYSEDSSIVTISSSGLVKAKAEGTAYVFAILDNGKFVTCLVNVSSENPEATPEPSSAPAPKATVTPEPLPTATNSNSNLQDNSNSK